MKRVVLMLLFLLLFLPAGASAHGGETIAYLKIGDAVPEAYFLEDTVGNLKSIRIPQDKASKNYLVGEEIDFTIDPHALEDKFTEEEVTQINFVWDFGDGTKKKGLTATHAYKKMGSYILTITADGKKELNKSVLINVLPDNDYEFPEAAITVSGKKATKEDYNILDTDLNNVLTFDGSGSRSGAGIVKYTWDFGDDKNAEGKTVKHQYELPQAFATVVLRVEDENGFFADAFVNVRNSGSNEPNTPRTAQFSMIAGPVILAIIAAIVGLFLRSRRKKKS